MTDDELNAIEARANAATPGPWQTRFIYRMLRAARQDPGLLIAASTEAEWPDADFIANARADVPALIEELRAYRAVDRVRRNPVDTSPD